MARKKLDPVHPGEVLFEEFLKPMGISQNRLALSIGVHPRRINEIVLRKRGITADTALRLAKYFGTSAKFWLGLQGDFDLDVAQDHHGHRRENRSPSDGPHSLAPPNNLIEPSPPRFAPVAPCTASGTPAGAPWVSAEGRRGRSIHVRAGAPWHRPPPFVPREPGQGRCTGAARRGERPVRAGDSPTGALRESRGRSAAAPLQGSA